MSSGHPLFRARLAGRIALRDLRGGLGGFWIFIACIALGVAAISGVGSISRGLGDGLAREGRQILGGDVSFSIIHREMTDAERTFLDQQGKVATLAVMRAMARKGDGASTLVEIKAVPASYPTIGTVELDPPQPLQPALASRDGTFGFVADAALAARLNIKPGDRIAIGDGTFEYRAALDNQPDKLATGIGLGPQVIMSLDAFRSTGLAQPGSLVRWINRVILPSDVQGGAAPDAAVAAVVAAAREKLPDAGWEVRTRSNVSPQFEKSLDQLTQFLVLVGLTALVVGGVGVANAVHIFVERKRADLATLKSVGATGGFVFAVSFIEVTLVAIFGVAAGLVLGAALPFIAHWTLASVLPIPLEPAIYPRELAAGAIYGLLTVLTFSLAPLGRAHDIPVSALFRDAIDPGQRFPRRRYIVATMVAAGVLAALIVGLAPDHWLAGVYVAATIVGFAVLRLVAMAIMDVARRLPPMPGAELRLAIANIHRPGALTASVVLSLGLGLALLVTLGMIDGNIRNEVNRTLPGKTPSFFFLDIRNAQADAFADFLHTHAPDAKVEEVPMLRGRVVQLNGLRPDQIKAEEKVQWVLEGDRGITFGADVPEGSTITDGNWWAPDYKGPPLVSMEEGAAHGLGLKVGDTIVINVLGRNITATIANLRKVNWRTLGINFVFVFSPSTFAGAPYSLLATATYPQSGNDPRELALLRDVANAFPAVTSVRVKDALDALNEVMAKVALAIRGASSIALVASVLVLAGALAAGRQTRIYDAVVLKTLGATRGRLLATLVIEYSVLGLTTAIFGVLAGAVAAWAIVTRVMKIDGFLWLWSTALTAVAVSLVVTIGLGLLGTWRVLGQKPAPYLREL